MYAITVYIHIYISRIDLRRGNRSFKIKQIIMNTNRGHNRLIIMHIFMQDKQPYSIIIILYIYLQVDKYKSLLSLNRNKHRMELRCSLT